MWHSKHIARVLMLVIVVLVGFHIIRTLFTPKSFGKFGHYRADNVREQMAIPPRHGESPACAQCHDEKTDQLGSGKHSPVACEDCHAPLVTHVKDGERFAEMERDRGFSLCLRCHEMLDARRRTFPQIRLEEHLSEQDMALSQDVCLNCHDPHSPEPGG